jgi:nucleoid-associated protein YgaU
MMRRDLDTPSLTSTLMAVKPPSCLRFTFPGILLASCAIFGAAQCYAQDVADAARQERAQKESQQKKSKHVYTEQDLKRDKILTPEDRAQVEAKKSQPAPALAEKRQDAVDAQELAPNTPLGDVARRLRRRKESQKLQQSTEFHLPVGDAPALASPKPPVMPIQPRLSNPAAPRFAPYQPPVKRSPFERPGAVVSAPPRVSPSRPPAARVAPAQPSAPITVAGQSKLSVVTVKPGDSLWKLAQQNLGKGLRWRDLLAVNPGIVDGNHIVAGSQIYVPATASPLRTATKFTVHKGDTLTKIAQTQLGHASFWACIALANPAVHDANLIFEGQQLLLPASCEP